MVLKLVEAIKLWRDILVTVLSGLLYTIARRGRKFRGFEAGRSYKIVAGYFGNCAFRITVYDCSRHIQNGCLV